MEALFEVRLPVRDLFQAPTLGGMAARIAGEMAAPGAARPAGETEIRRASRDGAPLPLSFAQERLWFLDRFAPGSAVYNIPSFLRLGGRLDAAALRGVLTEVARRHESLRTTFGEHAGVPFQAVAPPGEVGLPLVDLRGAEDEMLRLAREEARRPFDLVRGPLFRASLLRLGVEDHVLLLNIHHIVSDGWSQGLLLRELAALYHALAAGRPSPLPEPPIQYADYAVWQRSRMRGEALEEKLAFWRQRLAGVPPLALPSDRPRPARPSFRGGRRSLDVPADLAGRLRALCREQGVTSYMALLAAFQVLLLRYSGQTDFAVGSPVANRGRGEVEGLIGLFINTLALRADLSGRPAFRELLRRVRETALAVWSHEEVPFEKVVEGLAVEREAGRNPVFQVILTVDNQVWPDLVMGGLEVSAVEAGTGTAKLDLALVWQERDGLLLGTLEHSSDLFDDASAERMARHAVALLRGALEAPDRTLGELPMLAADEVRQLVVEWNGAPLPAAPEATLDRLVAAQAARTPERVAVVYEDGSALTYGELDRRSDRLALRLQRLGVGLDAPVGVLLQRSPELVISLLAIWKAGGAYLPLDPSYPGDRLAFMLVDAGVRVVITLGGLAATSLPGSRVQVLAVDAPEDGAGGGEAPAGALPRGLAYVLYTSGSTGRPKAVGVEHEGLARHLRNIVASWELTAEDRVLMLHSPSFDPTFEDVVAPLLLGGGVAICGPEVWEPAVLLAKAFALGVTVMPLPTTLWDEWVRETSLAGPPEHRVRMVTSGGEAMSGETARLWWRSPLSKIRLLNGYGPTEAVIAMKYHDVDGGIAERAQAAVEIGSPYPGRTAYVLDPAGGLQPPGAPGELCLGGPILGRGYVGRPDLTAERFVPDPFAAQWGGGPGGRMYRTGDLARRRPDGALEFLGRVDHQVKVRGFRVELGEIEAALDRHSGVGRAVVVTWKAPAGDNRLAAFVIPAADPAPTAVDLRSHLAAILPAFMVPPAFTFLESLPVTTSHKVDRRALARMAADLPPAAAEGYVAPRNGLEEVLAPLWAEVLGVERVGVHDDFFALGGHSLLAIRLVSKVDDALGVRLPVGAMFHAPTLGEMAERIAEALADQAGDEFLRQISSEREEYEESSHG